MISILSHAIFSISQYTHSKSKNGMRKSFDGEVSQRTQDRRLCLKETYGAKLKIGENIVIP